MNETFGNVPASRTGVTIPPAHRAFFKAIPKVELHCHLLGAVRHQTFIALAEKSRAPLERAEIDAFYTRGDKPVGVLRVLRALDEYLLTDADDLRRITYEYLEDAAAHNVRHAEFFWNPTGTVRVSKIEYGDAQAGIVAAVRDASRDFGMSALPAKYAASGLVFTVVPTNSYYLRTLPPEKWAELHPIRRMPGLGLKIHPNTDDPALHKVNPSEAWELMFSHFGFGTSDLRGFMLNGIDA